jgi:uncharacterized protein YecT (DUF1311 family)
MKVAMKHPRRSMRALSLLAGCSLAFGSAHLARGAAEEPSENQSLAACQRYATQHYQQTIQLLDEDVNQKKYEKKVGSQLIGTVLSGHGIWKEKTGVPSNVHFICLLETVDKPVFIDVMKDGPRDPVAVCWDGFAPAEWGKMTDCLQGSLKREEAALAASLTKATQQAGQSMDKLSAKKTLQESNVQWVKYRDSECDRRQAFVAGRNHPDIGELTCKIRKTAERISDLKFDE